MTNAKKVHVALNVSDVKRSAAFYQAMFGLEPAKQKPGYVKFDIGTPPLNLTLNQGAPPATRGVLNHLGLEVESTEEVLAARARLESAGLVTVDEMNVDCCFALQDKIWISDPDGNRWEIFTVKIGDTRPDLEGTDRRPEQPGACCQ